MPLYAALSHDAIPRPVARHALNHLTEHDLAQVFSRGSPARLIQLTGVEIGKPNLDAAAVGANAESISVNDVGDFAREVRSLLRQRCVTGIRAGHARRDDQKVK
jgi:hypothetical protein